MTHEQVIKLAVHAGMSVDELTTEAMLAVMVGDPNDPRHGLAYQVWQVGQEIEAEQKRAQLAADGWQYYPRNENGTPMHCPNGHEANLTGGKHPVWTCRVCDMTEIGYEENGAAGYWLRWQVIH